MRYPCLSRLLRLSLSLCVVAPENFRQNLENVPSERNPPMLTKEEIDAIEECVNTREDEGYDVSLAQATLEKLKKNSKLKFIKFDEFELIDGEYKLVSSAEVQCLSTR